MPLAAGTRLGPYQTLAPIGAGGMGEVYRAHDPRMGRDVAVKISAERFSDRFSREVRAVAALNHPNICQLYDVGPNYLVMELVEGPTLAERLKQGPIPPEEALTIAKQIAEAVEAAHEKGIIHRDLKPGNIKLRPDGAVKVLDFGLARLTESSGGGPLPEDSPTLTLEAATRAGTIVGTAAYMSPEQARGKVADKRSDIWSFGAVLYEMLTGKRAFEGESISETLASVLKDEPDWNALPPAMPESVRTLTRRCLTRDRKQRLQAIGEARIVLENPVQVSAAEGARPRSPIARIAWIVAAGLFAALAAVSFTALRKTPPQPHVVRITTALPLANGPSPIAFSPDGSMMAFVGTPDQRIYVRPMDQFEAKALPEQGGFPCFSPDGKWISFISHTSLKKIAVDGGPAQTLVADLVNVQGPPTQNWTQDGNILFSNNGALMRIPSAGGKAEMLAMPEAVNDEKYFADAQLLPGGQNVLLTIAGTGGAKQRAAVLNLKSRQKKILLEGASMARYLQTGASPGNGHLVYYDPGTGALLAVSFNANRLEVKGSPVPVLDRIQGFLNTSFPLLGISDAGTLAYVPGAPFLSSGSTLVWMDRTGDEQPVPAPPRGYFYPRLSPDGERIALSIFAGTTSAASDIWIYNLARGTFQRVTSEGYSMTPIWTPDGRRLIYERRFSPAGNAVLSIAADGSSPPTILPHTAKVAVPSSVSPDGKLLGFYFYAGETGIWELPLSEAPAGAAPQTVLHSQFHVRYPEFSPDGHWVAFTSHETDREEIYVARYPGFTDRVPISTEGGIAPRWARDGRELFYSNGNKIMAVDIRTSPALRAGVPKVLFAAPKSYLSTALTQNSVLTFDVSPDGKRFLMVKQAPSPLVAADQVNIVLNWFEELRRRVPLGRD